MYANLSKNIGLPSIIVKEKEKPQVQHSPVKRGPKATGEKALCVRINLCFLQKYRQKSL